MITTVSNFINLIALCADFIAFGGLNFTRPRGAEFQKGRA